MLLARLLAVAALLLAPVAVAAAPGAGFDVEHYEVALTPDFAARTVSGHTRIRFHSTQDALSAVSFSPNALTVTHASIAGQPVRVERSDAALSFVLPRPLSRGGTAVLEVSYAGKPARGVVFGERSVHAGYFACQWMICLQDSPGDKASFALDLYLPKGLRSLSVGRLASVRSAGDLTVHAWREPRAYSPYLFAFASGAYREIRREAAGAELVFVGAAAEDELARLFAPTADMLRFFQDKAGVPLPGGAYAQLLVDGSEAQEAATFSLLGRPELTPMLETPQEDWAIAHELAHQWWGNLVTCRDWSEFWLNEGVTTFMVAAWKEQRWGRAAYDRELALARRRLERARAAGFDKPLAWPGEYPSLPVRRAVQYSKGALFLDALRAELGDDAFWAGLRRYTRDHAGGVVTSRDFQRAMERAAGRRLDRLFATWVYGP
jgi:aminopeptidase N